MISNELENYPFNIFAVSWICTVIVTVVLAGFVAIMEVVGFK